MEATAAGRYFQGLRLGNWQLFRNLAMIPVFADLDDGLDYGLLDEAIEAGEVEVSEVSQQGVVPEIRVTNKGARMVLMVDGEELVGAKQNRILNVTILVAPHSTLVVPVSCVEQGRWDYGDVLFRSGERILCADLRARKARQVHESVRTSREFRSNQGEIWEEIASKASRMQAVSPSMAMAQIYQKESGRLEEFASHFDVAEGQVGAVFAINDRITGMDGFGKPRSFFRMFRKLLESYALDAIDREGREETRVEPSLGTGDVERFLRIPARSPWEGRPSVGLGTDLRLETEGLIGAALAYEDRVLHTAWFVAAPRGTDGLRGTRSRMARPSRRGAASAARGGRRGSSRA